MAITVFTHALLRKAEEAQGRLDELEALVKEFAAYKRTGKLPITFGRDFPYDWPRSAVDSELQHLHLHDASVKRPWLNLVQYRRTSDTCLVYCQGSRQVDHYLLIALLRFTGDPATGAHARQRKVTYMMELAEIAEKFRRVY